MERRYRQPTASRGPMARATSAAPLSMMRNATSRKPKSPATISDVGMTWLPCQRAPRGDRRGIRSRRGIVYKSCSGAYSVSCRVRGGYWHERFSCIVILLIVQARSKPNQIQPSTAAGLAGASGAQPSRDRPQPAPPSLRGANPKRTWRQTQADVAPNPNPCQLFPIAAHCRFEPFQGLGRSRDPLRPPCRSKIRTCIKCLFNSIQIPPTQALQTFLLAGWSFRAQRVGGPPAANSGCGPWRRCATYPRKIQAESKLGQIEPN